MSTAQTSRVCLTRKAASWRTGGIVSGTSTAVTMASTGTLGRGVLLAAPLAGLCVLVGVLGGELTVGSPTGHTRSATLEVRRVRDYVPADLSPAVAFATAALAVLLASTSAMGSADDLGRAGRALQRQCSADVFQTHGPWAGSYYTWPLATLVLVGLVATAIALHSVVRRPRLSDDVGVPLDDLRRRASARAVVGACGVLVTIPLIGVSLVTAAGLVGVCHPASRTVAAIALVLTTPVWFVILAFSVRSILNPTP